MKSNEERFTITSALPYIHGVPHLGNITAFLPADLFHRYKDIRGVENEFIWGSDVHGTPLELEAIERGVEAEDLKNEQHQKVKKVLSEFNFDFSIYSDTHSEYNRKQTHDMFEELYCNGHIKEKEQTLPYCRNDERFLPDRYVEGECPHCGGLARGDQCDDCGKLVEPDEIENKECQICGETDVEMRKTTHLFLDLPQFKEELLDWVNSDPTPIPKNKVTEVENAIEETEPRCITRDIEWGFDLPIERINTRIEEENLDVPKLDPEIYKDKTAYVWFDAPIGYIGFTRELFEDGEEWKKYWTNNRSKVYYSLGKDNLIFHTIMWPAMLLGSSTEEEKYNLPHYEFASEFLLAEDTKFSKSRGKGLSTEDALEMYPADYWRFYLVRNLPQGQDKVFSWKDYEKEINNVLNDTAGNFVNRTLSLAEKWFDNEVPVGELTEKDNETVKAAEKTVEKYVEAFENHDLTEALEEAVELARIGDRYLSEEEPWNNEDRREETIDVALQIVRGLGATLYPFTPEASKNIAEMLDTEYHTEEGVDELVDPLLGGITPGTSLGEREQLFEKIDVEERKKEVGIAEDDREDETGEDEDDNMTEHDYNEETVSFEEFQDMKLRTGVVKSVEEHPNADRLYKVEVDVGDAVLQTCAGLVNHYGKEELEGKTVVVLANLEPTELRGEKSECMMLAADDDETVALLQPEKEVEKGSEVV